MQAELACLGAYPPTVSDLREQIGLRDNRPRRFVFVVFVVSASMDNTNDTRRHRDQIRRQLMHQ